MNWSSSPHARISRETVGRRLAENDLKPWRKEMWCIPQIDAEYVARMEDVLDLYAERPTQTPVVCFDESPTQLIGEARQRIPARPGQPERMTASTGATGRRTCSSSSTPTARGGERKSPTAGRGGLRRCMRELTSPLPQGRAHPGRARQPIHPHAGALYQSLPACEARRVLRRLEFHYVPKHASWLNMVEIEIWVWPSRSQSTLYS